MYADDPKCDRKWLTLANVTNNNIINTKNNSSFCAQLHVVHSPVYPALNGTFCARM